MDIQLTVRTPDMVGGLLINAVEESKTAVVCPDSIFPGWTVDLVRVELAPGDRPAAISTLDDEPEKMYLVHECGEAFDSMETAVAHECNVEVSTYWQILPESEAM